MKSYIIAGIGIIALVVGILFFWMSQQTHLFPVTSQNVQSASSTSDNVETSSLQSTSSINITPNGPSASSTSTSNETAWNNAQNLIKNCEVKSITSIRGGGTYLYMKNGAYIQISDAPAPNIIQQVASVASSSCGMIQVGSAIPN